MRMFRFLQKRRPRRHPRPRPRADAGAVRGRGLGGGRRRAVRGEDGPAGGRTAAADGGGAAAARGEELNLTEDELAFYDALEVNDSAVAVLGDETLQLIARELVSAVRRNATIDWTLRENVRAQMRVIVKRILKKHGYPPDKQEKAKRTVLEQAELLAGEWANG